jgi:hypothetical protein
MIMQKSYGNYEYILASVFASLYKQLVQFSWRRGNTVISGTGEQYADVKRSQD